MSRLIHMYTVKMHPSSGLENSSELPQLNLEFGTTEFQQGQSVASLHCGPAEGSMLRFSRNSIRLATWMRILAGLAVFLLRFGFDNSNLILMCQNCYCLWLYVITLHDGGGNYTAIENWFQQNCKIGDSYKNWKQGKRTYQVNSARWWFFAWLKFSQGIET